MNNKDILNELHNSSNDCIPSERLNPASIEKSLASVQRRSYKGVAGISASLTIVCLTLIGFGSSMISQNLLLTGSYAYNDVYKAVNSVKEANETPFGEKVEEIFDDSINDELFGSISSSANNAVTSDSNAIASNSKNTTSAESLSSPEYSETNTQVKGVDEADFVKTDGKYIYSVSENNIYITEPNNGEPINISFIECNDNISNIYIHEDNLVAFSYTKLYDSHTITNSKPYKYSSNKMVTKAYIYDLSDIYTPVEVSNFMQSGQLISSRKIDDIVYFTTSYSINNYDAIEKDTPETFCPIYGVNSNVKCVDANDIVVTEDIKNINYVTVASIDLNKPQQLADICSVLGSGSEIYSSTDNLYVASSHYSKKKHYSTQIIRFSLNNGEIEQNGSLSVDGELLNQFAMDEYNGYFRIVTEKSVSSDDHDYNSILPTSTSHKETALYIFDKNLNLIGKTEDVAKNENVKSVRFDGDIAYFVTFRNTDPLFTVDLSSPSSPKILSELKIPGFSEYLHVFDENLLLGFGREADPEFGSLDGLKLTMFDTSDKTDVSEIATRIFSDSSASSEAEDDHKAIFVDEKRGIIGIPYSSSSSDNYKINYAIFQYDKVKKDFILLQDINLYEDDYYNYSKRREYKRGLYIDDYFYIVTSNKIYTLDYSTFELHDVLSFSDSIFYQQDYPQN
ncbi:MAG: beta-propeller domain-containing protein [Acutalibacteraceae bacterium]|nr:beta-propeller domain-containing protein [Acutalibacteraceae bacterium]